MPFCNVHQLFLLLASAKMSLSLFDLMIMLVLDETLLPSILKDTFLFRERLLAFANNFSGEEVGSGDDSGGKVGIDKLGS